MSETNPLQRYYRRPELYMSLPSQGNWWNKDSLELPPNGEIAVLGMSGKDDMAMRNADGLMNGATTVEVIQSCCPSIKNAWDMPIIDADAVLIAIRIASYGNTMEFKTNCGKCNEELSYEADLRWILENIKVPDYDVPTTVDERLHVYFKPDTFQRLNKNSIERYQQQRAIQSITQSNLPDEEKIERLRSDLIELTKFTVEKMSSHIDKIMIEDGTIVSSKEFIQEFIKNADQKMFNSIKEGIESKNNAYEMPKMKSKCSHCNHEEDKSFTFEPTSFFAQSS